jgi:hypothetical protein
VIVTKTSISRRAMLRGFGATIALPFLDAMVPALSASAASAATPIRRLGIVYVGNGVDLARWIPRTEGADFELTPILAPLSDLRKHWLVLTGIDNQPAVTRVGEPGAGHGRCSGSFLTGVHAKPTEGADFRAGVSIDQIAAAELGRHTQLASLELGLESTEFAGACDAGYSCTYTNTLCWRTPTTPLPMENNPRAVFERLFGDSGSTSAAARAARMRKDRSILDSVTDTIARLQGGLGARDRARLAEYLAAIRDIERRIQKAEEQSDRELPEVEQPAGAPTAFGDYARLMFDLQVLAYQSDLTRVITFMVARDISGRTYPEAGVPDAHHALSHHMNDPEKLAKMAKINAYHVSLFAYYLERLRTTQDGDGSLLDHVTIMYGSSMGNPNEHDPHKLPIVLAGGGAGRIHGGRHVRYPEGTPLTNLYMSILDQAGVPVEQIGDSTGKVDLLAI